MRPLLFAANWKMQVDPAEARAYAAQFLDATSQVSARSLWFFPPAVSLEAASNAFGGRTDIRVGAQDVHWEPKGAFTGATSIPLAGGAGASGALVGHSERRHVFGETDAETGKKTRALLQAGLTAFLCVGEKLEEREAGQTESVVLRQLRAGLGEIDAAGWPRLVVAYEPVWAIGTGRNATAEDAATVHRALRAALAQLGASHRVPILYGGSVNRGNAAALLAEPEIDGVLVGGASLDPKGWAGLVGTQS
jgi:triosephosphate isomerase